MEAATVDGANGRQRFFYITLRYILPILSIIFVLVLKEGLMIYDYIMAMTSGGPAGATESITLSIYRIGFEDSHYLTPEENAVHNYQLVEKLSALIRAMDFEPATPDEAREIMGIRK